MKRKIKRDENLPIGKLTQVKDTLPPPGKVMFEALDDLKHKRYVTLKDCLRGKRST